MSPEPSAEELAAVLAALRLRAPGGVAGSAAPDDSSPLIAWRHRREAALGQSPRRFPAVHGGLVAGQG